MTAQQFPYLARDPSLANASLAPMLPLTLNGGPSVQTSGLVDSGATINVLPYALGMQLGFEWDQQTRFVELSGNLASVEARVVVLSAVIGNFPPVRMAFAWAKSDGVSVILGQVNFFMEFDICFFRTRGIFEVRPKT
jgi:Aspartyl protease